MNIKSINYLLAYNQLVLKGDQSTKLHYAVITGENGKEYLFKSARGRIYFEKKNALTTALHNALGCSMNDWQQNNYNIEIKEILV